MGCASVLFGTLTVLRITSSYPINISFSHPKAAFLVILSENRKFARWKSISGGSNNAGKLIYSLSCVYWGEWTKEHSRLCDWANWQIGCKANAIKHVWIAEPQPMFSKKKYTCEREQSNYQIFRILKSVYISRYSKLVDIIVFRISRYALAHSFAQKQHSFISTNFEYILVN